MIAPDLRGGHNHLFCLARDRIGRGCGPCELLRITQAFAPDDLMRAISNRAIAGNATSRTTRVARHVSPHDDPGSRSETILGDFEHDNTITYQGVRAEMVRENGGYWMKFTGVDGKKQQLEIVRTVGSRRIQQYLTKMATMVRLPIAYDLVQHRWMHLNGSFFFPDGSDYKQHVAEWNSNCVFCHNVKAQPHLDWD